MIEVLRQHMEEFHDREGGASHDRFMAFYADYEPLVRLLASADPALAEKELRPVLDQFRSRADKAAKRPPKRTGSRR
jgi:hypothetical protein